MDHIVVDPNLDHQVNNVKDIARMVEQMTVVLEAKSFGFPDLMTVPISARFAETAHAEGNLETKSPWRSKDPRSNAPGDQKS